LLATATLGGVGQVCAVMTPCMRLYAHLGSHLFAAGTGGPYAAWIDTYADPAFADLATSLERQLDRHATDDTATTATYRSAVELELAFFDAPLNAQ
jgi:thiaminase/transcriptional activator TenA